MNKVVRVVAVVLAVSLVLPQPLVMAQGMQGGKARTSVLPSGGGEVLHVEGGAHVGKW